MEQSCLVASYAFTFGNSGVRTLYHKSAMYVNMCMHIICYLFASRCISE